MPWAENTLIYGPITGNPCENGHKSKKGILTNSPDCAQRAEGWKGEGCGSVLSLFYRVRMLRIVEGVCTPHRTNDSSDQS